MQTLVSQFERLMYSLASELGYTLSESELHTYLFRLQEFGLAKFAEACLEFREQGIVSGTFPSVDEFKRMISGNLREK